MEAKLHSELANFLLQGQQMAEVFDGDKIQYFEQNYNF
jgi:hypothetical protein